MTIAMHDAGGATSGLSASLDAQLGARWLATSSSRRLSGAVEVVRAWMIGIERSWLAVDITRSLPDSPFHTDGGLCAAVRNLPKCYFGGGWTTEATTWCAWLTSTTTWARSTRPGTQAKLS